MRIYVSLFGKQREVLDWQNLLEQERVPFEYKGPVLKGFSQVNIVVGFPDRKVSPLEKRGSLFIREDFPLRNKKLNYLRKKLRKAFESLKLPYVHLWYYPVPSPTIFLFRQDIDYVHERGLKNLLEVTGHSKIRGTYFVNISGEEEFDEEIGHLKLREATTPKRKEVLQKILSAGNELANHGYWHYVFRDFGGNYENIRKGNLYLKKLFGISSCGFAAPGGESNARLIEAIDKSKISYSSFISLDDNSLPYYLRARSKKTGVLEIPVYFLCDASFRSFTANARKRLKNLYLEYIDRQIKNGEPIAILGHPHLIGKTAKEFYGPVFRKIRKENIPNYTFQEFADWWKRRGKAGISYNKTGQQLTITADKYPALVEVICGTRKNIIKIKKRSTINIDGFKI